MTGRNSGAYELLTRHFLKLDGDARLAFLADSQRAVVQFVATHPLAVGVVTLAALRDSALRVHPVDMQYIDTAGTERSFVKLHQASIALQRYAYHFPVYIYFKASDRGVASGFSTFITSAPGQKVFLYRGLVPRTQPVRLIKLDEGEEE
jgi:ABC-type phosphate transport system substrate-binding protein